jgi:hypothetical protein
MYFNSSLKLKTHPSRERKNIKILEFRDHLEDIGVGGRIILIESSRNGTEETDWIDLIQERNR